MELENHSISTLHNLLIKKEIKSSEIVESVFEHISDSSLNCYIALFEDSARKKAKELDKKGDYPEPLTGIPIAIKDNICIKGEPTTCGSKILEDFIPPYNATVIEKLENLGVIFIGKTNMDEFAMGSSTENSYFGPTLNPIDNDYVPGGSSGGSAAAVANKEVICALGSDTGGSIRQPASFCGIFGLKPTYGRVSRYGLVAFASSLDQIGPLAKNTQDIAILLSAIAGRDVKDSTSEDKEVPSFLHNLNPNIKGIKIGIPKEYFTEGLSDDVRISIENAINIFKDLGATTEQISLPHTEYAIATYYLIATAEASSNLARYDGVKYGYRKQKTEDRRQKLKEMYEQTRKEGFGDEIKRRIMLGTFGLQTGYYDEYYLKAREVRNIIKSDFDDAFERVNIILTPTYPIPAFKLGEKIEDPLEMYLSDIFTVSVNLAGLPAISVPIRIQNSNELPIGVQLIGRAFCEQDILNCAYAYETL